MTPKPGIWKKINFEAQQNGSEYHYGWIDNLHFSRSKIVFNKGEPSTWDDFGVRDPALLVDSNGYLVRDGNTIVMYYTGSTDEGLTQACGRAISNDDGQSWVRSQKDPVLSPRPGKWDGIVATTPWVIKMEDGTFHMYYCGGMRPLHYQIGLAVSQDGIHFERKEDRPILTSDDFRGMKTGKNILMAVLNMVRTAEGQFLLTFEANPKSNEHTIQIFGAISDDARNFKAMNNGHPIFTADQIESWPVTQIGNPRIILLDDGMTYMMAFNGFYKSGLYAMGLAYTKDFKNWWEHPGNPILCPSGIPADSPFSGRIEGGIIVKEDLKKRNEPIRMFFMAIPRNTKSHGNSVIAVCEGSFGKRYSFKPVCNKEPEISIIKNKIDDAPLIVVNKSFESPFPPRAVFLIHQQEHLNGVSLKFHLESEDPDGEALISIGEEIDSAVNYGGIKIRFKNKGVYLKAYQNQRTSIQRILNKFLNIFFKLYDWQVWTRFHQIDVFELKEWNSLVMKKEEGTWEIMFNEKKIKQLHKPFDEFSINSISLQSDGIKIESQAIEVFIKDCNRH